MTTSTLDGRRTLLSWHVTSNFYPSLPAAYADVALTALGHLVRYRQFLDRTGR